MPIQKCTFKSHGKTSFKRARPFKWYGKSVRVNGQFNSVHFKCP